MGKREGGGEVFQISSGARQGLSADIRGRQRRYAISMGIRTVCVILFIVLWHVQIVVAWVALVLGAVLPYVAVVFANGGRSNATSTPQPFIPAPSRHMLEPGRGEGPGDESGAADEPYRDGSK